MKVSKVSVTYGRKLNMGDYQSANVECMLEATLEKEDSLDLVMHTLWDTARANVRSIAGPIKAGQEPNHSDHLGLPQDKPIEPPAPKLNGLGIPATVPPINAHEEAGDIPF
jgi:hypothetical protein